VICAVVTLLLRLNRAVSAPIFTNSLLYLRRLLGTAQGLLLTFFCSHLAFLLIAYATNNQPEIWPRYGLIFFALGLPLLASQHSQSSNEDFKERAVNRRKALTIYGAALLFAVQFCVQLIDVTRMTVKSDPNVLAAEFLEDQHKADKTVKIYCDDGAIRVLSGIPLEEFRNQYNSPVDEKAFIQSLRDNQVRYLVYKDVPGSPLQKFIRELRSGVRDGITIEEVIPTPRKQTKDNVVVYRVHESEMANAQIRPTTHAKLRRTPTASQSRE
jgi:hypothetical protein